MRKSNGRRFFFRADANGDGTLTREEAQQARESLFQQQPLLRLVLQKAKPTDIAVQPAAGQPAAAAADPATTAKQVAVNPQGTIGALLDSNHDQKIEATELRQAVQTGVQALFSLCDTNQDAQLTPYELNAAVGEAAKSAVQTVFQAADLDRNGQLTLDEYDKALAEPAHALFRVIDADNNNNLSLAEIQQPSRSSPTRSCGCACRNRQIPLRTRSSKARIRLRQHRLRCRPRGRLTLADSPQTAFERMCR